MDERAVVEWQLGRPVRAFRRVAHRCPHGFPAVTEQAERAEDGTPFPTAFWLTCPWLVAELSRIEAGGGVRRWSAAATADEQLSLSLSEAHATQRRLRPELGSGVAGSKGGGGLKCLHAHVAFALGLPGYELGERILDEVDEPWCPDARCGAADAGDCR